MPDTYDPAPNDPSSFWMPFTANRQFKENPRMLVSAKDMHYDTIEGQKILDGTVGLWCVNAGHARPKIVKAIQDQVAELERIALLHDPSTIAAVIIEPVAGSTGVLIPPKGYLERVREICDKHGFLLIFDEVITGFGRLGSPFAADYFDVKPDMMTTAKGLTSGVIPMGAVIVSDEIHDVFMHGPEHMIEFFHGYTYSGNPVAAAADLGTLETYADDGLLTRAADLADHPHVIDVRNIGLIGAIELQPIEGAPTRRAFNTFLKAFERGYLIRTTGDIIALSPPLIITTEQIDELIDCVGEVLRELD